MRNQKKGVLVLGIIPVLVCTVVFLPGLIGAGDPKPSALGMKKFHEIPPSRSHSVPASQRFVFVLDQQAVLDKETGLVWERSPDKTARDWTSAINYCQQKSIGGSKGWRLPTIEELTSLADPTRAYPALPSGHSFLTVQVSNYWSCSTDADDIGVAWTVHLLHGNVCNDNKNWKAYVWCVRSGQ